MEILRGTHTKIIKSESLLIGFYFLSLVFSLEKRIQIWIY